MSKKIKRNRKQQNKKQQNRCSNKEPSKLLNKLRVVGEGIRTAGKATGHGIVVGTKATGNGLAFAGKWTAAKVMLLIEKIKSLRSQINELNDECAELAAQMQLGLDRAEMIQISKELEAKAKQLRKLAKNLHKLESIAKEEGVQVPLETQTA